MMATNEYNKIDSQSTQLMTLTTKIEQLQAQLNDKSAALTTSGTGDDRDGGNTTITPGLDRERIGNTSIEKWRVVKKDASIVVDGKTYWWCPKHVDKSTLCHRISIYVTHKPEDHNAIMAKRYGDKKSTLMAQMSGTGGGSFSENNLVVSQKLKEVLCSKLMISDVDTDSIYNIV